MEPRAGVHLLVTGIAMVTQWNVCFYWRDSDRPVFIRVSLLFWTVQTLKVIIVHAALADVLPPNA